MVFQNDFPNFQFFDCEVTNILVELILLTCCELVSFICADGYLIANLFRSRPAVIEAVEGFFGGQLTLAKLRALVSPGEDSLGRHAAGEHLLLS